MLLILVDTHFFVKVQLSPLSTWPTVTLAERKRAQLFQSMSKVRTNYQIDYSVKLRRDKISKA